MPVPGPPPLVPALEAAADQQSQPALTSLGASSWMSTESKPEQSHTTSELVVSKFTPEFFFSPKIHSRLGTVNPLKKEVC